MLREFVKRAAGDVRISPTFVPELVHATLDLLIDEEIGIWHITNHGAVTWEEFARLAGRLGGIDKPDIIGRPVRELGLLAYHPGSTVLMSERACHHEVSCPTCVRSRNRDAGQLLRSHW